MPRWLLWSLAALISWGVWAVISKVIGDALSAAHSQALSTLGMLPVLLALAFKKNPPDPGNRKRGIIYAFVAGLLACGGNVAYYSALNRGGKAATVVALTALYPLVTVGLAVLFLRETLNRIQIAGVVLSLLAIYLFNVSSAEGFFSSALLFALAPIGFWGLAGFFQKISTQNISGEHSTLWFLGAFVPVAVLILLFQPLSALPSAEVWIKVAALGLFFALGNFALLAAFSNHGKASVLVPLTSLYPVVSVPIAILFLGEKIGGRESAGILLALVSVAALSYENPTAGAIKN